MNIFLFNDVVLFTVKGDDVLLNKNKVCFVLTKYFQFFLFLFFILKSFLNSKKKTKFKKKQN